VNFINRRQLMVEWGHCDPAKIVFNSRYFEYADWSTALLFEAVFKMNILEVKEKYAVEIPLVDVNARFIKPVMWRDVVEIASEIDSFKRSSFVVLHQFFSRGEHVAEVQETRVWVEVAPGESSKFSSKPIPNDVVERFKVS